MSSHYLSHFLLHLQLHKRGLLQWEWPAGIVKFRPYHCRYFRQNNIHGPWNLSHNHIKCQTYSNSRLCRFKYKYQSSCQNALVCSFRKRRRGARKSSSPLRNSIGSLLLLSSSLAIKVEVTTCTIIVGSGSSRTACSSLLIHGSILCSISSLAWLFPDIFWN